MSENYTFSKLYPGVKMGSTLWVACRKGLAEYTVSGGNASFKKLHFEGAPAVNVLEDPRDGAIYVSLNHGHFGCKIHRLDKPGGNWVELSAPKFPDKPDNPEDKNPWSLHQVWCMEPGGKDEPGKIYAGTIPGGLFVSNDRGENWELMRGLWDNPERLKWNGGGYDDPGIHSIMLDPKDSKKMIVGVSVGGAWLSEDGGKTWSARTKGMKARYCPEDMMDIPSMQDPHLMVQSPSNPDVLWTQHHSGVFRSTDYGNSWSEITPAVSGFGYAVAVHPQKPDTAWFVPADSDGKRLAKDGKVVATRTEDGGKTFKVLSKGLPQKDAFDIVYRHALDITDDGQGLAMGSTTGSLWYSPDGGEGWISVNQNLPPVYAVRFGR